MILTKKPEGSELLMLTPSLGGTPPRSLDLHTTVAVWLKLEFSSQSSA
jgi:hypothetical protein